MCDDGTHTNVNETIDVDVFKRWRADPSYRPQNLVEWTKRKNVDPGQLQTSVRTDDPSVACLINSRSNLSRLPTSACLRWRTLLWLGSLISRMTSSGLMSSSRWSASIEGFSVAR